MQCGLESRFRQRVSKTAFRVALAAVCATCLGSLFGETALGQAKQQVASPITHIVFLIKENRSFDNIFGLFPGADGASQRRAVPMRIRQRHCAVGRPRSERRTGEPSRKLQAQNRSAFQVAR